MLNLHGFTFDDACVQLEANGYHQIAEGDWAYVYASPDAWRVIRITPYDPAYLLFVYTCWTCPHTNLPAYSAVVRLAGHGYAVEMPRYVPGDVALREGFMAACIAAMDSEDNSSEFAARGSTHRAVFRGNRLAP
jgi:hypothetical protein